MASSMLALDPSELTQQQVDVQSLMPSTCNITRPTGQQSDGAGGVTESYRLVAAAVTCMHYPARALSSLADDIQQNDEGKVIGQWIFQFPFGTVVQKRDRLTVIETGRVFEAITTDLGSVFSPAVSVKASLIE